MIHLLNLDPHLTRGIYVRLNLNQIKSESYYKYPDLNGNHRKED